MTKNTKNDVSDDAGFTNIAENQKFDPYAKRLLIKTWVFTRGLFYMVGLFYHWTLEEITWMLHNGSPGNPIPPNFLEKTSFLNVQLHGNEFISRTGTVQRADTFKILPISLYRKGKLDLNFNMEIQVIPRSMKYLLNRANIQTDNIAYYQNENLISTRDFAAATPTLSLWLVLDSADYLKNTVFIQKNDLECQYTMQENQPKGPEQYADQTIILAYLDITSIDGILKEIGDESLSAETNYSVQDMDDGAQPDHARYNERIKKGLLFFDILFNAKMSSDEKTDLLHQHFSIEKSEELRKDVDLLTLPLHYLQEYYDCVAEIKKEYQDKTETLEKEKQSLAKEAQSLAKEAQSQAKEAQSARLYAKNLLDYCKEHGYAIPDDLQ